MNDKYADLQIDDVTFTSNTGGTGYLIIDWTGRQGFGQFTIGKYNTGEKTGFVMDDECMSKDFCMALLEKLYDKCEGEK